MSIKVQSGIIWGFVKTLVYSRKGLSIKVKNGRRRRGLMVGALDSRSSGLGSSLSRGTALCSWARHFSLTVPLPTQVYNMDTVRSI